MGHADNILASLLAACQKRPRKRGNLMWASRSPERKTYSKEYLRDKRAGKKLGMTVREFRTSKGEKQ